MDALPPAARATARMTMTPEQMQAAMAPGAPREWFCYHRGLLGADCGVGPEAEATDAELAARDARGIMWAAYEAGTVTMAQRKHGDSDYEYLARRAPRA